MKKIIGITLGDPAGIGPEIILKALRSHPKIYDRCVPVIFGHTEILRAAAKNLGIASTIKVGSDLNDLKTIRTGEVLCLFSDPRLKIPAPGKITARSGGLSYDYLTKAIKAAMRKQIDAIVTAPIHKVAWSLAGVPFLDHTSALQELTGSAHSMTMFQTGNLRIFFHTRHLPLREVPAALNKQELFKTIRKCVDYLELLGISEPEIAVAALNPHAGDNGLLGTEEMEIIQPAVLQASKAGVRVSGPVPADAVFFQASKGKYDAVLSLYHDQGHIAAKTLDFYGTVSLTLGLPFLRTSVDHGTAMDIAGKNQANPEGMAQAILAAARYVW